MELRSLRSFVTLAEQQHFTRAALSLEISQPSLSEQIRKLEGELGVELFHRTKRSVHLTGAGHVLLAEARSLLSQAETMADLARQAATGEVGNLAVGFVESSVFSQLPRLLSVFRTKYPKVNLKLRELSTEEQLAGMRERSIDVGILRTPIQGSDIETKHLSRESLVVVLPRSHKLARRPTLSLRALRNEKFILYARPEARRLRDEIVASCHQVGFTPFITQEAQEYHTLSGLVAAGLGISFVPSSARAINIRGVVYRKLVTPEVFIDYAVAWLRASRRPALSAFKSILE